MTITYEKVFFSICWCWWGYSFRGVIWKKSKFPSYNLKVNFKINQKHSPKISNKSFSSKGPSPSILLPNQYQIFFYVQKKFWRHQHKKKELNFSLCCLLLTTPIDTACRLWWSILIKFAIETRKRKKFSLIFSISLFNNFHVLLMPTISWIAENLCCFCRCDKFSDSLCAFPPLFFTSLFASSQGKMEISFSSSCFFFCVYHEILILPRSVYETIFSRIRGEQRNLYVWKGHGSKGKWHCRASRKGKE